MDSTGKRVVWFCCSCGDGPMSISISDTCYNTGPNTGTRAICGRRRCRACPVELIKTKNSDLGKRRGLNARSLLADAALLSNMGLEDLDSEPSTTTASNGVYGTIGALTEPHLSGATEPPLQAPSGSTEPHTCATTHLSQYSHQPEHTFQFPNTSNLSILPSFPLGTVNQACQTDALSHQAQLYNPTFTLPVDFNSFDTNSVWPNDHQPLPLLGPLVTPYWQNFNALEQDLSAAGVVARQSQPSQRRSSRTAPLATSSPHKKPDTQKDEPGRLACPFWKKDLHRAWSECRSCRSGHKRIRDVKQHIYRHHTEESQAKKKSKTDNVNLAERLTESQVDKIGRYSKRNTGERAQWFAIWDILFPKLPRPASPYINEDLATELDEYDNYCLDQHIGAAFPELDEQFRSTSPTTSPSDTLYTESFSPVPFVHETPSTAILETDFINNNQDGFFLQDFGFWCNHTGEDTGYPQVQTDESKLDDGGCSWGPPW